MAVGQAADRDVIISGSYSGTVRIWDAVTHDPVGSPLPGSDRAIYAVAIGRAGDRDVMVSGSADGAVRVWDAVTHELVGSPLPGSDRAIYAVAIGRAGDRDVIVSGSADRTIFLRTHRTTQRCCGCSTARLEWKVAPRPAAREWRASSAGSSVSIVTLELGTMSPTR